MDQIVCRKAGRGDRLYIEGPPAEIKEAHDLEIGAFGLLKVRGVEVVEVGFFFLDVSCPKIASPISYV